MCGADSMDALSGTDPQAVVTPAFNPELWMPTIQNKGEKPDSHVDAHLVPREKEIPPLCLQLVGYSHRLYLFICVQNKIF